MSLDSPATQIRPDAVVPAEPAHRVLAALKHEDVAHGGVWNAAPGVWQRYDKPWDGAIGNRGSAQLVGSIAVAYDAPRRNDITIYRATITPAGASLGWTGERLVNEALGHAGLTLENCGRGNATIPRQRSLADVLRSDVTDLMPKALGEIMRKDVLELIGLRRGA